MWYSPAAITIVKRWESCRLEAYADEGGVWTIGYGHTGEDVKQGDKITQRRAEELLAQDMADATNSINGAVDFEKVKLTQYQFDALVSFVFNVGPGHPGKKAGFVYLLNGEPSTMLKFINDGMVAAAATQFERWCNVDGRPSAGLRERRIAERDLYNNRHTISV